jgi:hypothetical protein
MLSGSRRVYAEGGVAPPETSEKSRQGEEVRALQVRSVTHSSAGQSLSMSRRGSLKSRWIGRSEVAEL